MSLGNFLIKSNCNMNLNKLCTILISTRQGHILRGKPPGVAKTLNQRLAEDSLQDDEITKRVNIGFPQVRASRSAQLKERLAHVKAQRANSDLEKQAREKTLLIDLEEVHEEYVKTKGKFDLRTLADHYGIFKDLFGNAYFVPRVNLHVNYSLEDGSVLSPVYNGNLIKPAEAINAPEVTFDGITDPITNEKAKEDTFWTLVATNPDGHLSTGDAEYVHWFISNLPNGDVKKGDVLVDYLPPFPAKGLGYQRFVFVLYKQNKQLDMSEYQIAAADHVDLAKRTFRTLDFYRKYQDEITPAGLAFYQTKWDESLTRFYHEVLGLKEPIFEYDFPAPYMADQKFFPLRQPFNIYLDKHRDVRDVNKRYLEVKLKETHPFEGPPAKLRYPAAHPIRDVPSWLKTEIRKKRLSIGRWADF